MKLFALVVIAFAVVASAQLGSNLPTGAVPSGAAPTGAAPTGAAPTGAAPTGAAPTGAAPTGAAPTGAATTGAAPTGAAPTSAAPTGAAPTGSPAPTAPAPTQSAAPVYNFSAGVIVTLNKTMDFTSMRYGLRDILCGNSYSCLPGYYNNPDHDIYLAPGQPTSGKKFVVQTNTTEIMMELLGLPQQAFKDENRFDGNVVWINPAVTIEPDVALRGDNQVVVQVINEDYSDYRGWERIRSQLSSNLEFDDLANATSKNISLINSSVYWNATMNKYVQNFTIACDLIELQVQIQGMDWTSIRAASNPNVFSSVDVINAWYPSYVDLDTTGVPMSAADWGQRIQINGTSSYRGYWRDFDYVRRRVADQSQSFTNPAFRIPRYTIRLVKSWATRNPTYLNQSFTLSLSKSSNAARVNMEVQLNLGNVDFGSLDNVKAALVSGGAAPSDNGGAEKKKSNTGVIAAVVVVVVVAAIVGVVLMMRNRAGASTGTKDESYVAMNTGGQV